MDPTATSPSKDPHLPPMGRLGDLRCPRAPQTVAEARLEERALTDLAVKFAYTINRFTADWLADRMKLSPALAADVIQESVGEGQIEETMMGTRERPVYRITERGRNAAARAMEVNGYLGPAPVSLEAYSAMTRWQFSATPEVKPEHVTAALSGLVLAPQAVEMAGLAVSSGRSLFVYGPSGNGKSSLGRMMHAAMRGDIWVPYCISVRNTVIRIFDEQIHQRVDVPGASPAAVDARWVRVRRPMVVVGGELTLEYLDLIYSESLRYYEAPPHLKSNGGVFLVDDFGRERVAPHQLLNRFITPMEHHFDYFTLATGQKIQVPLRHVLIIATNLSLESVTDPAFLRRMGYRVMLEAPTPEGYARIFTSYAEKHGATVPPGLLDSLLGRYKAQGRDLRACEPRDLIERARDICRFHGRPLELTPEVMDLAWAGYFGTAAPPPTREAAGVPVAELVAQVPAVTS
jgi:DNA-binding PadR family transcriptional regulator/energy-coupling factor transporter ATP-binding protein EcfA2